VKGTAPACSFSCSASRQEPRLKDEISTCRQPGRRSRQGAFRKTACLGKRSYLPGNTPLPARVRTTTEGPFGELLRSTGPMAKTNPFRFSTKFQDDETDLLYYGNRYLNTSTGRWFSRDPAEESGGLNLYEFVGNAPTGYFDLFGMMPLSDIDTIYNAHKAATEAANYLCPCECGKKKQPDYNISASASGATVTATTDWKDCPQGSDCCGPYNSTFFWWDCYSSAHEGGRFGGDDNHGWSSGTSVYTTTAQPPQGWRGFSAWWHNWDPYHLGVYSLMIYEQCVNGKLQTMKQEGKETLMFKWVGGRWTGPKVISGTDGNPITY